MEPLVRPLMYQRAFLDSELECARSLIERTKYDFPFHGLLFACMKARLPNCSSYISCHQSGNNVNRKASPCERPEDTGRSSFEVFSSKSYGHIQE